MLTPRSEDTNPVVVDRTLRLERETAQRIAELEQRVQALEARIVDSEAARATLSREVDAARDAQHRAEATVAASEDLLATIAHDLRNPLGTIMMGATALQQTELAADRPDPRLARVHSVAERIHRQAERMTQQIANLGDFAVIRGGRLALHPAPCAPALVLRATETMIGGLARERGVELSVAGGDELRAIDCDADRLVQALTNLVTNAIRVTPRSGRVEVTVADAGDRVVFSIRDGGPGLDADERAAMFEARWRPSHPSYKSTALGFAIARGIADAHHGAIWATGAVGAGTTVHLAISPGR